MNHRAKHLIEYGALRAIAGLLSVLPYRAALAVGWGLAAFSHFVLRVHVRRTRQRIRAVFGAAHTEREIRRIAWVSWRNFVFTVVDILRLGRTGRNTIERFFVSHEDALRALRAQAATGEGAVIALPHMGSWDLTGVAASLLGLPMFTIAGRQRNPLVDRYLQHVRRKHGLQALMRRSSLMRGVLRGLREGRMLAIVCDVRVPREGVRIPFLGGEANLGSGLGLFARHAGVPVFPCVPRRIGWSRHTVEIAPPVRPDKNLDKQTDVRRLTASVMEVIEQAIREHPEQWFWYNSRWVLEPLQAESRENTT